MRIALIEDNVALADAVRHSLEADGLSVDMIADGAEGDAFLATAGADVVILDLTLPGLDGLEVLRRLRARGSSVPVLILTALGKTSERVAGLRAGADDYLVKPFAMEELVARVQALGRRRPDLPATIERIGRLSYSAETRQLHLNDTEIDLPRRERALFEVLLVERGRILSREQIAERLYGTGSEIEPNAIEILVSRLRRKIEGSGAQIRTARGLGYMLGEEQT
jgi:two-component system, OmpR family, response regulator